MIEVEGFITDYDKFRDHCDGLDYEGITNPFDGIFYPGVSVDIPEYVKREVIDKIEFIEGKDIDIKALFLRLSTENTIGPHQAHTDSLMGKKSLMLYMSREEDCQGGTAFVTHETGMNSTPVNEYGEELWKKDTNNPDKWEVTDLCEMKPNKACIFDASLMHRAEPIGGFGINSIDGRLVLTAFYDC